ncbi:MAG: glycosyl hydrolase 53 family protein [Bacteroidota bacterium]
MTPLKFPPQVFITLWLCFLVSSFKVHGQCFTTGADLSYVNSIITNGGQYADEGGNTIEPFTYFAERGAEMVRLRLWHTPENLTDNCGGMITNSNLSDVLAASQLAMSNDMDLNIAIHYGDHFNDPGWQLRPAAWAGLDHTSLLDSIYNYTYAVLEAFRQQSTIPAIIGVGNETTWGFIDNTTPTNGWTWPEDADKFNIAFDAIDHFNNEYDLAIKKAIHLTEGSAAWATGLFASNGIINYDVIGISYYPNFSPDTEIQDIGNLVNQLVADYSKEVMIFETGFVWFVNGFSDNYTNFMNDNGNVISYPASPQGQKDFLLDLAETVHANGGSGVLYWEPGWITSDLCTLWGQGSSYENVTFFDFDNNNSALPAFDFFDFCGVVSNEEVSAIEPLVIFPNPVIDHRVNVQSDQSITHWRLFSLSGNVLEIGSLDPFQVEQTITFKGDHHGIFILELSNEDKLIERDKVLFY